MASFWARDQEGNSLYQILELLKALLPNYIFQRIRRDGDDNTVVTREQLGGQELSDPGHKAILQSIHQISDELDGNAELQRLINDPMLSPTKPLFLKVALEIFTNGIVNWGRVVALFYFAYKLVVKALLTKTPDLITSIINWTIDFLQENVSNWIRDQGGWEGIHSYVGTPTWQTVAVFLAGVLTAFIVLRKK